MDFSDVEIHIFGTSLDFYNGETQTGPKISIYLSEKSIYAYIYVYIWIIQICAYIDFLDGETHIVSTSSDFSIGEIQMCAKKYGI
jgi:hypothetical protein